jgi:hypothetical protein
MSGLRAWREFAAARTESSAGTVVLGSRIGAVAVGSPIEADTVRVPARRRLVVVELTPEPFVRLRPVLARLDPPVVATLLPPPPMRGVYPPGMVW